ncbi:MAG: zinc-dependent metalloprotease [Bacteroidia bacterium]|nr:zinc-dependent metalloprotease [Bacteroidia bacterium]
MKTTFSTTRLIWALAILLSCTSTSSVLAQGIIRQTTQSLNSELPVGCGSHHLMKHIDRELPGFMESSNQWLQSASNSFQKHGKAKELKTVEVVFHVVYEDEKENLSDSVIQHQLDILNKAFRGDLVTNDNLRPEFHELVGDSRIEFKLAQFDPNGNPTSGITRTNTSIANFGGILPYSANQRAEIDAWVEDSLMPNLSRIMSTQNGGIDAWDTKRYLNIWIGDLSVFEPKINNFEEVLLVGLATSPAGHENFKNEPALEQILQHLSQGVLMQYNAIGPENPSKFEGVYSQLNDLVTNGLILVHEVGHYLGLRHIWGDGDCHQDDFIDDTPKSNTSSQFNCVKTRNTCIDTILGKDLPDMVENFMDYSNGQCQNSFTNGQIHIMRSVLENHRSQLVSTHKTPELIELLAVPNPTTGKCTIELPEASNHVWYTIRDSKGSIVAKGERSAVTQLQLELNAQPGLYIVTLTTDHHRFVGKVLKR